MRSSDCGEKQITEVETSTLVELYLTKTFLKDLSEIMGTPVSAEDPDVVELVDECVTRDHLGESVTHDIRVLRFGELNEHSVYYTRAKNIVRTSNQKIYFRKYVFIKATVGQKRVDIKSSTLRGLGKTLVEIMTVGVTLNRVHAAIEKMKDLAQSLTTSE